MFVQRNEAGAVKGAFTAPQPDMPEEELADDDAELVAFLDPPPRQVEAEPTTLEDLARRMTAVERKLGL